MSKPFEEEQELRQRRTHDPLQGPADDGDGASILTVDKDSPGVRRIEAIVATWKKVDKIWFIVALVILTYGRSTAATVLGTFQAIALNEFGESGRAGMVKTVRQVLTASTLPISAKLSDYIGRGFMLNVTVVLWIIGAAVTAKSTGLSSYLPGFLLYTLGHVAGNILNYALSLDTTTLRNRLFLQFVFIFPSIINVWAGGRIAADVEEGPGWRWGAGMWGIIIPVLALGVYAVLIRGTIKAKKQGLLDDVPSAWSLITSPKRLLHFFWVADLIGLLLLAAALALILLPLSLGGGSATNWRKPNTIVPLVIGVLCLPAFAFWEKKYARHPMFPFHVMKDRHVMLILLLQFFKNIATSTRDAYLYFTLVVSFNQGTEGATRINSLESFAGSLTMVCVAFIVRRFNVVKPFIVLGVVLVVVAQGMHIHFRGGYSTSQLAGVIAAELIEGIGSGMSSHPALVAMQAKLSHEHGLLVTSCWAVASQAAGGIAAAISGAIWTNLLPGKLLRGLESAGIPDAKKLSQSIFKSPLSFVKTNPPGSPARDAVLTAYRDVQRTLCIVGIVFAALTVPIALFIENVKLDGRKEGKEEVSDSSDVDSIEVGRKNAAPNVDYSTGNANGNEVVQVSDNKNKY